jgi:uncharacterized protein (TIGR01244 family)
VRGDIDMQLHLLVAFTPDRRLTMDLLKVDEQVSVGGQPSEEELRELRAEGFGSIVNFRPANEEAGQLDPNEEGEQVRRLGMAYAHVPTTLKTISAEVVDQYREAIRDLPKPIFAHCKSGKRAGAVVLAQLGVEAKLSAEQIDATAERIKLDEKPELVRFVQEYVAAENSAGKG